MSSAREPPRLSFSQRSRRNNSLFEHVRLELWAEFSQEAAFLHLCLHSELAHSHSVGPLGGLQHGLTGRLTAELGGGSSGARGSALALEVSLSSST